MEVSGLTKDEIEAALQLIQLISSSDSRPDTTVNNHKLIRTPELSKNTNTDTNRKFKLEEESEDDSASVAYVSSSSPTPIEKILERQSGSLGDRKRKLLMLSSTRAQIKKEANAAQQLLQISEESSCCNISGTSYITDASSAPAAGEKRHDQERESSEANRGRSKSGASGFRCVMKEEEDSMEECLADIFSRRRRRKRKFRSLIDIYAKTEPANAVNS